MKKIQYAVIVCAIWLLCLTNANAQTGDMKLSLNYNYSFPEAQFKNNIINDASPRGFMGDLMYSLGRKWSLGLAFGYQDYYQKYDRSVYDLDKNDQVSAVLTNSLQATPVLVKGMFTPFGSRSFIQPYIAVAAGASFINFNQYLGEFQGSSDNSISLTLQGDAGLQLPFSKNNSSGFRVGASYNYVPYKRNGYTDLDNANVHAGFYFSLR